MKYFPLTVLDNFFPDIEYVANLSKKIEYQDLGSTPFPGKISIDIEKVDKDLSDWVVRKVMSIFWDMSIADYCIGSTVDFQKIEPSHFNYGLIHHETIPKCAVVIYLNDDCDKDSGTSFYKLKKEHEYYNENCLEYQKYIDVTTSFHGGVEPDNYNEIVENHQNKFEEVMRVQPKQNRMILYSPEVWHAQTTYGSKTRHTLRCFLHTISVLNDNREIMPPLLR